MVSSILTGRARLLDRVESRRLALELDAFGPRFFANVHRSVLSERSCAGGASGRHAAPNRGRTLIREDVDLFVAQLTTARSIRTVLASKCYAWNREEKRWTGTRNRMRSLKTKDRFVTRRQTRIIRRLGAGAVGICGFVVLSVLAEESQLPQPHGDLKADQAIARLEQGNRRCIEGKSVHAHDLAKWRERFLIKQKPFATVLGCSDSRVPPELLFDQGFGDLFVIRVAGNIVDSDVIGSIQYAVEHLDNKLIVVLGHQNCGAVTAALAPPVEMKNEPPELNKLLNRIRPAVESVDRTKNRKSLIAAAVEANVRASVKQLRQVPSIATAIEKHNVAIVGAVHYIDSGETRFLAE